MISRNDLDVDPGMNLDSQRIKEGNLCCAAIRIEPWVNLKLGITYA